MLESSGRLYGKWWNKINSWKSSKTWATFKNVKDYIVNHSCTSKFIKCGFKDVTSKVNLYSGSGLQAGDVLLNHKFHTAMMINSKQLAQASIDENNDIVGRTKGDQTGTEI